MYDQNYLFIRNSNLTGLYLHLFASFDTSILGMHSVAFHYGERYFPGSLKGRGLKWDLMGLNVSSSIEQLLTLPNQEPSLDPSKALGWGGLPEVRFYLSFPGGVPGGNRGTLVLTLGSVFTSVGV